MHIPLLTLIALLGVNFGALIFPTREQLASSVNLQPSSFWNPISNGLLLRSQARQAVPGQSTAHTTNIHTNMNMPPSSQSMNMMAPSGSVYTQHIPQMPMSAPEMNSGNPLTHKVIIIRRSPSPSTTGRDVDTVDHASFPNRRQLEPYVNLFLPTGRCTGGFFCRAVMTAYRNRQIHRKKGFAMTVLVGYTIFSLGQETATVPYVTRLGIRFTSDDEIAYYVKVLTDEMKTEFSDLCEFETATIMKAFKSVTTGMFDCTNLSGYNCEKYEFVASC